MFVIGITGGTGGGKTSALRVIRELGGHVIDCDALYHDLLETNADLLREIGEAFPGTVSEAGLDRKRLGRIVFADEKKLEQLNGITHRYVGQAVDAELAQCRREGFSLAAVDAIALIESGLGDLCDRTVAVTAPEEMRVQRLMLRENIPEEYARLRIRAQKSDAWFREHCDVTLVNDGTREEFREKCLRCFTRAEEIEEQQ